MSAYLNTRVSLFSSRLWGAEDFSKLLETPPEEMADTLGALQTDAEALRSQAAAESAACDSWEMMRKQFAAGGISYDLVLNADRQRQQALINRIKAQAQRFYDSAALFEALGAGEEPL